MEGVINNFIDTITFYTTGRKLANSAQQMSIFLFSNSWHQP